MAFDYKKEYKEYYLPPAVPGIVCVPPMNYLAVRGEGNPNDPSGMYASALQQLYGIAFTIKMSRHSGHQIDGFFDYVVPPLEGLWWQDGVDGVDYTHKETYRWISLIRLPDFVTAADVRFAVAEATKKKKRDFSGVEFLPLNEGMCVQCMHIGDYDAEPETVEKMHRYAAAQGYCLDISDTRRHHEIYLSDARRVPPEKRRTVIRHPIIRYESAAEKADETGLSVSTVADRVLGQTEDADAAHR